MARQNDSQPRNMTVDGFEQEMAEFVAHIKSVTTPNTETGRALFPEFELTAPIREKLNCAVGHLQKVELGSAFAVLEAAKTHFRNQQASYARRTLLSDLQGELQEMVRTVRTGDDDDLVKLVRTAVEAYEKLVGQNFFEPEAASKLFWTAIDVLNSTETEYKSRMEKKRQQEEKERKERRAKQDQETRARNLEQGSTAAKKLRGLLSEV